MAENKKIVVVNLQKLEVAPTGLVVPKVLFLKKSR